tara:strand:+ start:2683 stop:3186 length:504 start_codon:yes stop_codon:yes gene_type:complete
MDITTTLQSKRNIDTELIIQELISCKIDFEIDAHIIKQVGLQSIENNFDPKLSCGKVKELGHPEKKFSHPIFNVPYINSLLKELNMFRTRVLIMGPQSCYSYHKDPTERIHIPVQTNRKALFIIDKLVYGGEDISIGNCYKFDTRKMHIAVNGHRRRTRIHIVGSVF